MRCCGGEIRHRLVHRHRQHLGDRLVAELDLQRFAIVALALADIAGDIDVGQEVHLDLQHAVALARLAAPALDVEAEPAGLVAARPAFRQFGEPVADRREQVGIGGGVGPRRAADRRLVDVDDLVELFQPLDAVVRRRHLAGAHQPARRRLVQRVHHQRGLAAAGHAGDAGERAQRKLRGRSASGCCRARRPGAARCRAAPGGAAAARRCACGRTGRRRSATSGCACTSAGVPCATTQPPFTPAAGPMSIRWSAARIASSSCSTTSTVLPRSRSRRSVPSRRSLSRWCRPIEGSSSTYSTPVRPEPIWLARRMRCDLAAGQRGGPARQGQVVQPDIHQELQPIDDLAQDAPGDLLRAAGSVAAARPGTRPARRGSTGRRLRRCCGRRRAPPAPPASAARRCRRRRAFRPGSGTVPRAARRCRFPASGAAGCAARPRTAWSPCRRARRPCRSAPPVRRRCRAGWRRARAAAGRATACCVVTLKCFARLCSVWS